MAIDKKLQIFDDEGNPVDYDILASDVKFNDGKDLPTKLDEMEDEIGEGGYTPPQGGIPKTDLAPSVQQTLDDVANKVDKETGKGLSTNDYTTEDKTKLGNLPTADQLTQQINSKANDNAVVKGIKANGASTTLPVDQDGVVELPPAGSTISPATATPSMDGTAAVGVSDKYAREDHVHPHDSTKLSKSDVSVETQGDGTVDINVGSGANKDTYTINLNHTHENMAKLVVDTAANLPDASEMESDTIYGELDDGEIATIYLGGYPFYGGGGGASSGPVLRRPADGATINMGQTTSGTVSKTINVKGKSLTQALTIELDGTGYTFGTTQPSGVTRDSATQLTLTAAAANALNGVDIVVVYTGSDTDEVASGTLGITSAAPDSISVEATLVANKVTYEDLAGVKLTGTQWLQTDFVPTPNTDVEMKMKLTANSRSWDSNEKNYYLLTCYTLQSSQKQFTIYAIQSDYSGAQFAGIVTASTPFVLQVDRATIVTDKSTLSYSHSGVLSFKPGENGTPITAQGNAVSQQTDPLTIGFYHSSSGTDSILNKFDLTIYELKITDNGSVVRDFKPMRKNGVPGLLDTAANGTGAFISSKTSTPVEEVTSNS